MGVGDTIGQILEFTKLTGDLRHSFQTTVFDDHTQEIGDFLGKILADDAGDQVEELIIGQLGVANQQGQLRVRNRALKSVDGFDRTGQVLSAGITLAESLIQALSVGARNRRKFSHS
ncbi:hypothetical protein HMPREF9440_00015 [Sutterella parvirubra YIT 11816]|uniref:Uncharacterized protein n=1 Tax=Sutterella parvirubra YIT 11816 TaxID=762967 RepID=H3KBC0_9BURK|nr:hypothetical protein HMPREF9440_00015 [Sutterella parvirubra YIT 11816]